MELEFQAQVTGDPGGSAWHMPRCPNWQGPTGFEGKHGGDGGGT